MLDITRLLRYTMAIDLIRVTGRRHILDLNKLGWPLYANANTSTTKLGIVSNDGSVIQNQMFIHLGPIRSALDSISRRQDLPGKENDTPVVFSMGAEVEYGQLLGDEFSWFVVDSLRSPL